MDEQLEKINNILEIRVCIRRNNEIEIGGEIKNAQETETTILARTPEMAGKQVEQITKDFLELE